MVATKDWTDEPPTLGGTRPTDEELAAELTATATRLNMILRHAEAAGLTAIVDVRTLPPALPVYPVVGGDVSPERVQHWLCSTKEPLPQVHVRLARPL